MQLFDFLPHLFSNSEKFDKLNNNERAKFFFMTNRFCSIQFPHIANNFNHLEINSGQAIGIWHDIFKKFGKVPGWLWQGIKKQTIKSKTKEIDCSEETEKLYCEINEITYKEFERLSELYPDELQKELNELSYSVEQKIINIKTKKR